MAVLPSFESYQWIWAAICLRGRCICMLGLTEIDWHPWHAGKLVEVKVRLERQDLDAIEQQAAAAGTNRAALIRQRAIVAEYSSEIVEILQAVKYDTEADTARLVKCVRDLDNARQQLLNIEVKLSYEESKSKETCGETDIDFDAMRQSIGRRLDRLRRAQGPKRLPKGADRG